MATLNLREGGVAVPFLRPEPLFNTLTNKLIRNGSNKKW
jgi:hypothetical protein